MSLHAELHRHLGGAIVPRIFWRYIKRTNHPISADFASYEQFEAFITRPRATLTEYLQLHKLIEPVQTIEALPYFVSRLIRGAYIFEGICYLELRHCPYFRTDPSLSVANRIAQMRDVVDVIGHAGHDPNYPLLMRQILCMHSALPYEVNLGIVQLAAEMNHFVCGIDLAGPDTLYGARLSEWITLFQRASRSGLKTTGHVFETANGCFPELLPHLNRIGHGIQIALMYPRLLDDVARLGQCLELCPTTYIKTGTLQDLQMLRTVFERCRSHGVDVVICTDNAGLHNVRLPWEFENLLTQDIISFKQLTACQDAAFKHAFAWPHQSVPRKMLDSIIG